ncbi:putative RNA-binding Zn ribbon-like protein [Kribbella aluminosa]|uniref:RNA-binding Zn ribbon-like protein n=1 Tax=Kribbella aluminosa TaxID=416017 RepID=A0ABS4UG22_9ACTN|nr:CGNR zinc finger domain-containing protein [Kribbella aluminosa]MBP2350603.1 putative RNA-binding Zn ribbon-like protein [Kribbella aluminosa]
MRAEFPDFRLGTVLATSFTATLTERCGEPVERIPTPERLVDWLAVSGLAVDSCTPTQLELARDLRESIHAAATAAALQDALPASAVQVINDRSTHGRAAAILTPDGNRQWQLDSASRVEDALSVIAADAISIISGERDGKLALCASPTCQAAFFDTSQSRTRRWCDMNTCGNRQKKARFNASHRKRAERPAPAPLSKSPEK